MALFQYNVQSERNNPKGEGFIQYMILNNGESLGILWIFVYIYIIEDPYIKGETGRP